MLVFCLCCATTSVSHRSAAGAFFFFNCVQLLSTLLGTSNLLVYPANVKLPMRFLCCRVCVSHLLVPHQLSVSRYTGWIFLVGVFLVGGLFSVSVTAGLRTIDFLNNTSLLVVLWWFLLLMNRVNRTVP